MNRLLLPMSKFVLAVSLTVLSSTLLSSFMSKNQIQQHNFKCDKCVIVEPNYNEGWVQFIITGTQKETAQFQVAGNGSVIVDKQVELRNDVTGVDVSLKKFTSGIDYTVTVNSENFKAENNFRIQ